MGKTVITRELNRIHVVLERESQGDATIRSHQRSSLIPPVDPEEHPALSRCFEELDQLVGLKKVKEFVREIYALLEVGRRRAAAGLPSEQQVLHMVFTGNPGTGKTTVARIMSRLLKEMGILSKGHLVEVERADLVGEYIGHTAQKTREHVKRALGGILFVDEAYSLARGGERDFGKEAIDTLVKSMEDHRDEFVLILAGYSLEMEHFMRSNPGLPSRFPIHLAFPDFTIEELMEIADRMLKKRQYRFSRAAREKLKRQLLKEMNRTSQPFGNARYIRNVIERGSRHHAVRLLSERYPSKDDLMTIRAEDLRFEETLGTGRSVRGIINSE